MVLKEFNGIIEFNGNDYLHILKLVRTNTRHYPPNIDLEIENIIYYI